MRTNTKKSRKEIVIFPFKNLPLRPPAVPRFARQKYLKNREIKLHQKSRKKLFCWISRIFPIEIFKLKFRFLIQSFIEVSVIHWKTDKYIYLRILFYKKLLNQYFRQIRHFWSFSNIVISWSLISRQIYNRKTLHLTSIILRVFVLLIRSHFGQKSSFP